MDPRDPTRRFSARAEQYHSYRPGYPARLLDFLRDACALAPDHVVADVGCGTGLLAARFLENGNLVYGIEPNPEMRAVAERLLGGCSRFRSIDGRGERTTLPDGSVDFVAVGRAFHWLEPEAALTEFARIARPGGWAVILWFTRKSASPFHAAYEALRAEYARGQPRTIHRRRELRDLLVAHGFRVEVSTDRRAATLESLEGETLSYSDAPAPGDPLLAPMRERLRALFDRHQRDGRVSLDYELAIHWKRLA